MSTIARSVQEPRGDRPLSGLDDLKPRLISEYLAAFRASKEADYHFQKMIHKQLAESALQFGAAVCIRCAIEAGNALLILCPMLSDIELNSLLANTK